MSSQVILLSNRKLEEILDYPDYFIIPAILISAYVFIKIEDTGLCILISLYTFSFVIILGVTYASSFLFLYYVIFTFSDLLFLSVYIAGFNNKYIQHTYIALYLYSLINISIVYYNL